MGLILGRKLGLALSAVEVRRVHPNQHHRRNARENNRHVNAIQRGPRWIVLLRESTCEVSSLRGTATR